MLKALLKKQFLELNVTYFKNNKTGKFRSKAGITGMILLFALIFGFIAFAVYMMAGGLTVMLEADLAWLYFAIFGLLSIVLGVFGSVFNTYAGLYRAKDNGVLLSMPIPPKYILLARMTGVAAMSALYSAIVWVPAVVRYWVFLGSGSAVAAPVAMFLFNTVLVCVLTCLLGWLVAIASGKLKNKSAATVVLSLAFLGGYYYVYFNIIGYITKIAENAAAFGSSVKQKALFVYAYGAAAAGDPKLLAAYGAVTAALMALCVWILSKNFIRIATTSTASAKIAYKEQKAKRNSPQKALFLRELRAFGASPTRMLNSGIGMILLPAAGIVTLVKHADIMELAEVFAEEMPQLAALLPAVVTVMVLMILSMNTVSAPSVSLEGKHLWIVRSLPVAAKDVLRAKKTLHIVLNSAFAVVSVAMLGLGFGFSAAVTVQIAVLSMLFIRFSAAAGILLDLSRPNLTWTSEVVPVKQGFAVTVAIFGGWGIAVLFGAACWFIGNIAGVDSVCIAFTVLLAGLDIFFERRLATHGAERFENI